MTGIGAQQPENIGFSHICHMLSVSELVGREKQINDLVFHQGSN